MVRLAGIALDRWADLDGWAVSRNMPDLRDLPLDRFCNFIWWWATRNASQQSDIERFRITLWRPPPRVAPDPRSPWSRENETGAFAALKAGLSGKPALPSTTAAGRPPRAPRERKLANGAPVPTAVRQGDEPSVVSDTAPEIGWPQYPGL